MSWRAPERSRRKRADNNRALQNLDEFNSLAEVGEAATAGDLIRALPAAAASAMLERIGASKVFGITDKVKDATIKEIGKAGGRRAVAESTTEAVQEPIEQIGSGAGTKRWEKMTSGQIAGELVEASAQGAVVGLGFGGAVGTGTAAVQSGRGRTQAAADSAAAAAKAEAAAGEPTAAGLGAELPPDIEDIVETAKEETRAAAETAIAARREAEETAVAPAPEAVAPEAVASAPAPAPEAVAPAPEAEEVRNVPPGRGALGRKHGARGRGGAWETPHAGADRCAARRYGHY